MSKSAFSVDSWKPDQTMRSYMQLDLTDWEHIDAENDWTKYRTLVDTTGDGDRVVSWDSEVSVGLIWRRPV